MARAFRLFAIASLAPVWVALAQAPTPPAVSASVVLRLPITEAGLKATLLKLSATTRTPLGLELTPQASPRFGDVPPRLGAAGAIKDLTGLSMGDALAAIVTHAPDYTWSLERGLAQFRPTHFHGNARVALSRRLDRTQISAAEVTDILVAVHRVFDTSYPNRSRPSARPARVRGFIERPIVLLAPAGTTVRTVLNDVVRQHGAMSWVAEYRDRPGTYGGLELSFYGFDNWSTVTIAKPPRAAR